MAKFGEGGDLVKCSFCGKTQKQVKKLIAGPGVYICDECIDLCNDIIRDEAAQADPSGTITRSDLPLRFRRPTPHRWLRAGRAIER